MQTYSIVIPGDAVPQGRPRVVRIGGRTIAYDPPKGLARRRHDGSRHFVLPAGMRDIADLGADKSEGKMS